mmetsp:Transcript_1823/g.7968  ORF Transcript_1823/g.7968 Transcript_1823/m.7968 type:complete len:234 (-) Transcript_1823:1438-2139(-)
MTLRKRRGGGLRASIVRISLARISLAGISLAGMNGGVASVVVYSATRIPTQNARRETPIFFLSTRAVHDNPSFNHSLAHEKFAVRMSLRVPRSSSCSSAWAGTALSRVMRQSARSSVCRLRRSVATLMLYARKVSSTPRTAPGLSSLLNMSSVPSGEKAGNELWSLICTMCGSSPKTDPVTVMAPPFFVVMLTEMRFPNGPDGSTTSPATPDSMPISPARKGAAIRVGSPEVR